MAGPDHGTALSRTKTPSRKEERSCGRESYILEEQTGHLFRRAHQRAKAMFAERIGEPALTSRQYAVLIKLREHGSVSQNKLGRMTAMDPATVQGVVKRLAAKKLVARGHDPNDQRRAVMYLTSAGEAVVEVAIGRITGMSTDLLEPLSMGERKTFLALLRRLVLP